LLTTLAAEVITMARPTNNLLALAVLSYLTQRPMHAYELNRMLKENDAAKTFKLSYGALYGVVRQLAEGGLIQAAGTGQSGNLPRYTVYELTGEGRAEMRRWLTELLSEPRHEYPAFAAALSLVAVLHPDEVTDLLHARHGRIVSAIAEIRAVREGALASGVPPLFLVEDEYRIALLEAETSFITSLIAKITDPQDGWAGPWAAYHAPQQRAVTDDAPPSRNGGTS
jgi:DNA-binding PadR family transcriptional regulator